MNYSRHEDIIDTAFQNSGSQDVPTSPQVIPGFNFNRLHYTVDADTEKFHEKTARITRQQMQQEQEKVMKDLEEMSNEARMAGYGWYFSLCQ